MSKLTIHKNKGEVFQCQFKAEGTEVNDIVVRLCLEFSDNKNMFFYGELNEDGECIINIPQLSELKNKEGKLTVEAIADSMYFKLYESEVELKNSVEIKMETTLHKKTPKRSAIELKNIVQENKAVVKPKAKDDEGWEPMPKRRRVTPVMPVEETTSEAPDKPVRASGASNLKSFSDWQKNK